MANRISQLHTYVLRFRRFIYLLTKGLSRVGWGTCQAHDTMCADPVPKDMMLICINKYINKYKIMFGPWNHSDSSGMYWVYLGFSYAKLKGRVPRLRFQDCKSGLSLV